LIAEGEITFEHITVKMWIDPKSGAAMKVEATLDGKTQTTLEVLKLSVGKPPAESFVIPAACEAGLQGRALEASGKTVTPFGPWPP
jgi:hypothetical protein